MSNTSIINNNEAIKKLNQAINYYKSAITTIKASNNNSRTDEIIKLIQDDITNLESIETKLKYINSQISTEMKNIMREEQEIKESDR